MPSLPGPLHSTFNVVRQFVSPIRNDFSFVESGNLDTSSVAVFGWLWTPMLRQHDNPVDSPTPGVDGRGRYRLETWDKIFLAEMLLLDAQTLQVTVAAL